MFVFNKHNFGYRKSTLELLGFAKGREKHVLFSLYVAGQEEKEKKKAFSPHKSLRGQSHFHKI